MSQRGVGLLEIILILAIISVMSLAALQRYNEYRSERDVANMQQSEQIVMQAINQYFYEYCVSANYPYGISPTMGNLKGKELSTYAYSALNDAWGTGNVDTDFIVKINKSVGVPTTLNMTVDFSKINDTQLLNWYKNRLDATSVDKVNKTLTWSRLPRYTVPGMESTMWVMNAGLNQFTRVQNSYGAQASQCS